MASLLEMNSASPMPCMTRAKSNIGSVVLSVATTSPRPKYEKAGQEDLLATNGVAQAAKRQAQPEARQQVNDAHPEDDIGFDIELSPKLGKGDVRNGNVE